MSGRRDLFDRIASALELIAPPVEAPVDWLGHPAYLWDGARTRPIDALEALDLEQLRGIDAQKSAVTTNFERLASGAAAHDALLAERGLAPAPQTVPSGASPQAAPPPVKLARSDPPAGSAPPPASSPDPVRSEPVAAPPAARAQPEARTVVAQSAPPIRETVTTPAPAERRVARAAPEESPPVVTRQREPDPAPTRIARNTAPETIPDTAPQTRQSPPSGSSTGAARSAGSAPTYGKILSKRLGPDAPSEVELAIMEASGPRIALVIGNSIVIVSPGARLTRWKPLSSITGRVTLLTLSRIYI